MKVALSFPCESLAGKVKNLSGSYFRSTGGLVVLQKGRTELPAVTASLSYVHNLFKGAIAGWSALSNANKADWNTWTTTESPRSLDWQPQISGSNAYRAHWQTASGGRFTPRTTPPTDVTASRLAGVNYYRWNTGAGIWQCQALSVAGAEVGSFCMFEATTPNESEARPYRKEDLALLQSVEVGGSIRQTTGGTAWGLPPFTPARVPVIGDYVWIRLTLFSPSWWPTDQIVVQKRVTQV